MKLNLSNNCRLSAESAISFTTRFISSRACWFSESSFLSPHTSGTSESFPTAASTCQSNQQNCLFPSKIPPRPSLSLSAAQTLIHALKIRHPLTGMNSSIKTLCGGQISIFPFHHTYYFPGSSLLKLLRSHRPALSPPSLPHQGQASLHIPLSPEHLHRSDRSRQTERRS